MPYRATAGRSKVGPRSKVRTLSGQILPHFDINNFSVAQKLTKLDSLVLVQIKLALIIALISHKVCEDIQTSSLATILSWSKLLDRRRGRSKKIIFSSHGGSFTKPYVPHPHGWKILFAYSNRVFYPKAYSKIKSSLMS